MKSKPVTALPEVAGDLLHAATHYQSWHQDGREHIFQKYEETVNWIALSPDLYPVKFGRVQRAILKQSYYVVYFIQEADRSLVLAVLDARRNPREIKQVVVSRSNQG